MTADVTFRLEATPKTGLGHLRRCLILADHLQEVGRRVRFVCRQVPAPHVAALAAGHEMNCLGETNGDQAQDAEGTVVLAGGATGWVVVDSYDLDARWERIVRSAGHRVMALEDFRNREHHADLLVSDCDVPFDPALNVPSGRALAGPVYALVGPEYAYTPSDGLGAIGPLRVLVTYGGVDPTGETLKAIDALERLHGLPIGRVDVVVGHLNSAHDAIARAVRRLADATLHAAPETLAGLMRSADLVLTSGGNTMAEALALRRPCIVTETADNQSLMVARLSAQRLIQVVRPSADEPAVAVADVIRTVCGEFGAVRERVERLSAFDHLGAHRIAGAMVAAEGLM